MKCVFFIEILFEDWPFVLVFGAHLHVTIKYLFRKQQNDDKNHFKYNFEYFKIYMN
jgi:hypothetical protein